MYNFSFHHIRKNKIHFWHFLTNSMFWKISPNVPIATNTDLPRVQLSMDQVLKEYLYELFE